MLLDTNIVIYACQPGGGWLTSWTSHPDAAIASVTRIEALEFAGISHEEETAILDFVNASPTYGLDDEVIEQAIQLRQQKKMKLGDAIIAATAVAYNIPLVNSTIQDPNSRSQTIQDPNSRSQTKCEVYSGNVGWRW